MPSLGIHPDTKAESKMHRMNLSYCKDQRQSNPCLQKISRTSLHHPPTKIAASSTSRSTSIKEQWLQTASMSWASSAMRHRSKIQNCFQREFRIQQPTLVIRIPSFNLRMKPEIRERRTRTWMTTKWSFQPSQPKSHLESEKLNSHQLQTAPFLKMMS